jgi:NAD(P)H-dependent FMN reductase
MYLIISSSLKENSRSRTLGKYLHGLMISKEQPVEFVDLRDNPLPFCDGAKSYGHPNVAWWSKKITQASGIIVAHPVYNYGINSALKNLVENTGKSWEGKVVGFISAAGGKASYMSIMGFANSLMLDFRCHILPRFLYAEASQWESTEPGAELKVRLEMLADEWIDLAKRLQPTLAI